MPYIKDSALLGYVTHLVNRRTYHRQRMEAMGFRIQSIDTECDQFGIRIRAYFQCVCGKEEVLQVSISNLSLQYGTSDLENMPEFDPAKYLHNFGSFSREHLVEDGYTEAQIQEILKRGQNFDERTLHYDAIPTARQRPGTLATELSKEDSYFR